ncbi:hypothetical protein [Actinomadura coerulea]|uniref:hypothetical protein n=1 Tax=Actinomadura coerulea TaxID=46159 RepID=UPI003427BC4D
MSERELVGKATRTAVRRLVTDLGVAAIQDYWENEHFAAIPAPSTQDSSVRRATFAAYAEAVDWTDPSHPGAAPFVFPVVAADPVPQRRLWLLCG